jgi:hypothetical protein
MRFVTALREITVMTDFDGLRRVIDAGIIVAQTHLDQVITSIKENFPKEAITETLSTLRLENCGKLITKDGAIMQPTFPLPDEAAFSHQKTDLKLPPIIFVNGINCNEDVAAGIGEQFANACSSPVFLLYNQSIHLVHDVAESVTDKIGLTRKPAAEALSRLLLEAFEQSQPLHLAAHSHGAVVVSQGISYAIDEIKKRGPDQPSKFSEWLGSITVETFGGAATQYPDGPRYIHYVDPRDLIPWFAGVAKHGLSEEQIRQHEEVAISNDLATKISKVFIPVTTGFLKPGKNSRIIRIAELNQSGAQSEFHSLKHYISNRRIPSEILSQPSSQDGALSIEANSDGTSIQEHLESWGKKVKGKIGVGLSKIKDRFGSKESPTTPHAPES